jgi:hypothetical protein
VPETKVETIQWGNSCIMKSDTRQETYYCVVARIVLLKLVCVNCERRVIRTCASWLYMRAGTAFLHRRRS